MYVLAPGGPGAEERGAIDMAERQARIQDMVEWKLQLEVEDLRQRIARRARSLADDLERLAEGLEASEDFTFNTIGELQGNGVELDTWCAKLGLARDLLKARQSRAEREEAGA